MKSKVRKQCKKPMLSAQRARVIARLIRLIYNSLESHIALTHGSVRNKGLDGRNAFHKRCVREYAEMIKMITSLY